MTHPPAGPTTPPPPSGPKGRDYATEMRAVIDAEATGTYVPALVAAGICEKLRDVDPDLLAGWLDAQAEQILRHAINLRDCSQRTAARHHRPRSVFAADAEAAEAGEPERLAGWLDTRFTVEDGSRTPLRDLDRDGLLFASDTYTARAKDNQMMAAFLKAVSRKVRTGVVGDHFTDEALATMWDSLAGR
jgi:hypothetical protein